VVFHGSEPSGATLHRAEHTVQPLHEGIGDPVFPVGQNAGHVFFHRAGKLLHLCEQCAKALGSHPEPSAPGLESTLGLVDRGQLVGILESQAHLVGLHRSQITLGKGFQFRSLVLVQVLRVLAERPSRLLELRMELLFPLPDPFGGCDEVCDHVVLVVDDLGISAMIVVPR
jgi:hypothetical protein